MTFWGLDVNTLKRQNNVSTPLWIVAGLYMSPDAQKLGFDAQKFIGADGFGSRWIIPTINLGINTHLYIVTKNKIVQQLDLSHRLDLALISSFALMSKQILQQSG